MTVNSEKNLTFVSNVKRTRKMLYPIGIQDFVKIRKDGYVYVDKTDLVYKMAQKGGYYFLSRPRRFGKSLLVSTMEAYFSGKKELFEGLAIADLEKDWIQYPVLRMDLSGKSYDSPEVLQQVFDDYLSRWEKKYGIENKYTVPGIRFGQVIEAAYVQTGQRAVILIDEYDKPIMENLGNEDLSDVFRSQLQGFYSVMKAKDAFIKFGFLTGVTKMGKLSVFSGLNNLKDISMDARYTDICGISEKDLKKYFSESVKELAEANKLTGQECYAELSRWYDGYHFCENTSGLYNPFSLLNTFDSLKFREYWFLTGTPSFLVHFLSAGHYDLNDVSGIKVSPLGLSGVNSSRPNAITLLYQAGYLTIRDYERSTDRYTLDYPNKEVEDGFVDALSEFYTPVTRSNSSLSVDKFVEDIRTGNVEMLMRRFTAFFADMDYQIMGNDELYFQNTMYVMLKMIGQQVQVERHTSNGRIDVLIQTDKYVYIMELKRDKNPDDALDQIDEIGYDWPFLADDRKVFKTGANFSTKNHRLENWKVAE